MSHVPVDPTKPKDPLLVARPRPDAITLAGTFMVAGAFLGFLNGVLVIAATGAAARDFRARAALTTATPEQINNVATGLASASMTAGLTNLVLSLVMVVLAVRVWRGSHTARMVSLVVLSASILCGLGWSAFTVRGGTNLQPDGMDEATGRGISDALGMSTSGLPTYVGGGLTCLEVLGYVAVLGLLLLPSSNPYFRRSRTTLFGRRSRTTLFGRRSRTTLFGRRSRTTWLGRRSRVSSGPKDRNGSDETDVNEPVR